MPETEESQQNVAALRTDVEQIRAMQRFAAAATPSFRTFVEEHLEDMKESAEAYSSVHTPPGHIAPVIRPYATPSARHASTFRSGLPKQMACGMLAKQ